MNNTESKVISLTRLPLMLCVICIHNPILTYSERSNLIIDNIDIFSFASMSNVEVLYLVNYVLSSLVAGLAVPCFFFISGYLMYSPKDLDDIKKSYIKKIRKRNKSLIIPYVLWNALSLLPYFLVLFIKKVPQSEWLVLSPSFDTLRTVFWANEGGAPINVPLWFCRDLIVLTFISPLFLWASKCKFFNLLFVILLALYVFSPNSFVFPSGYRGVFFFGIGVWLRMRGLSFILRKNLEKIFYISSGILFCLSILFIGNSTYTIYIYPVYVVLGVFVIMSISTKFVENRFGKILIKYSSVSFFVYAVHGRFIMPAFGLLREKLLPNIAWLRIVNFIVAPFIVMLIAFIIYLSLSRVLPRFTKLLSGAR